MKKILVLALVFGLASAAQAALSLSVNGEPAPADSEIELKPSDTIVLDIHGDDPGPGSAINAYIFIEGLGSINGGDMVYPGGLSAYLDLADVAASLGLDEAGTIQAFRDFTGRTELVDLSFSIFASANIPAEPLDGRLVDGIIFHCEGEPGDVLVSLISEDFSTVYDSLIIHQIPEPMTLGLLGLGGLFLRRRK